MSDKQFERAVVDWLEDGSDRTPPRAIDGVLLAVKTTPQERDLRIPWRFPFMPAFTRATGIAAVALVAVVGAGGLMYLNSKAPSGPGGATATQVPTTAPTSAPTVAPAPTLPPGITGWTAYTSAVHGFNMSYPADWSLSAPATREWQAGDEFPGDAWPYADTFVSPGEGGASIGLFVWEMPVGEDLDPDSVLESVEILKSWAETFCNDIGASSCEGFTQQAVPMCLNAGGDSCRAAILVPSAGEQYAFFRDWISAMFENAPDLVRVVVVGRADRFPPAARYGGSVEILKGILTTMDVWTPGQQPSP